jgi:hypothetical protein
METLCASILRSTYKDTMATPARRFLWAMWKVLHLLGRSFPDVSVQDEQGLHLVNLANSALEAGITACGPNRPFKGIGRAIHELLKKQPFRYHVTSAFTGHGIGTVFHRPPYVVHDRQPAFHW